MHVITRAGKVPVYYPARDGDLFLDRNFSMIDLQTLDRKTHTDYEEIFSVIPKSEFESFCREFISNITPN